MSNNVNYQQMMAELQAEYLASMPIKIAEIENHHVSNDAEQLRNDFHKLKGTGKTYGIPEISELCEVCEKLCLTPAVKPETFVPTAVKMLRDIQRARVAKKAVEIGKNPEFIQIRDLLK